jgi:hypothetical protein
MVPPLQPVSRQSSGRSATPGTKRSMLQPARLYPVIVLNSLQGAAAALRKWGQGARTSVHAG